MELQSILSRRVLESLADTPPLNVDSIKYVAGVDAAYSGGIMYGVAVLLDYRTKFVVRETVVSKKPAIPYIPGLLAFREAPAYISALKRLGVKPDIIFVDGHGLSHPRAFGIATHVGLVLDTPSIGVAKKRLYGEEIVKDNKIYIYAHNHVVGEIIVHKGKKLYVSIGYRIRLEDAVKITKQMLTPQYKLPLPTALADQRSKRIARKMKQK
ncbi:MAG: endonuclease V [Desulfurococcales archaeon ex4484_58]|nr:MAG: endonuclease V [Desulfurococcales archaeon ex4484_58]